MIEVEVTKHDGFNVLNIVPGFFDGVGKLVLLVINHTGEDICKWRSPFLA